MIVQLKNVMFPMWSSTSMPEPKKGTDGKWLKDGEGKTMTTGKTIEYTNYFFKEPLMGEMIEIMSGQNQYREFEGKYVDVDLKLIKRTFNGKSEMKVSLSSVGLAKKEK